MTQVLLVEDSPSDANIIKQIFQRAGADKWQVTHVETLNQALNLLISPVENTDSEIKFTEQIQVVLLDLNLPDSNGLETVKSFRQALPELPVVVLTVNNDDEIALQAMIEGSQDYLVKDQISIQSLTRALLYAIERGRIIKRLQKQEQQTREELERQEEINQIKSQFVAMISHEFRTPMSTISTSLDLLRSYPQQLTEEKKNRYYQRIEKAIAQMLKMLDEVLFLSKEEAGRLNIYPVSLNLEEFCLEMLDIIQIGIGNNHQIRFSCSGNCQQAFMDEELLNCILTNLLSNAVKYSPLSTEIELNLTCANQQAIIQVKDRGIGIPHKEQSQLFTSFFRAGNARNIEGTGLGLTIVKRCVELQKGKLEIESQEGIGTTVTVKLPLKLNA